MPQDQPSLDDVRAEVSRMLDSMDPNATIAATVVFNVKKPSERAFEQSLAELGRATLRMPGVKVFNYHRQRSVELAVFEDKKTTQYLIYEYWESVSLFRAQWNSSHLQNFQKAVLDFLVEFPGLNFYSDLQDGRAQVLRTGQQHCWDTDGYLMPCAGTRQDGDIQAGVPSPYPRFADNNNGTVTDNLTGLIWLKNANLFGEVSWDQALSISRSLASGAAGLSDGSAAGDWRLPNVNEFQSLLHLDNTSGPAIAPDNPFSNLVPSNYWTATSVALAPPLGWFVALAVGPPVFDLKVNSMRMWPVRGGQQPRIAQTGQTKCFNSLGQEVPCKGTGQDADIQAGIPLPDPRFTDNNNGTVIDNLTGLIWLKNANAFGTKSWSDALEACYRLCNGNAGLSDQSKPGDWRLPNLFELRSLMDYSQFNPALTPGNPFLNVIPSLYWSSTTVPSAPNLARFVFVGVGPSVWDHKSVMMHVWPVQGGRRSR